MKKKNLALGFVSGLLFANGVIASEPKTDKDSLDINSIEYIEDEYDFELGFDTADYLPDDFDPNTFYFDINSVVYIKDIEELNLNTKEYLPQGFDPYAYPSDVQSINYIDLNDEIDFEINVEDISARYDVPTK